MGNKRSLQSPQLPTPLESSMNSLPNQLILPIRKSVSDGTERLYTHEEVLQVRKKEMPRHVAIIPDGNRRWATVKGLPFSAGYIQGAYTLIETALAAKEIGVEWLTVYSFSTENWKRPKEEIELLMKLFEIHLEYYSDALQRAKISLQTIGDLNVLPTSLQNTIEKVKKATYQKEREFTLTLALNYGGRDEIVRAIKKILSMRDKTDDLLPILSENLFSESLDTKGIPDPDLIVRTSGEIRLSNFLLWQSSYSEVYIENDHWPDFTPRHFKRAIEDYQLRERRLGGNLLKP